MKDLHTMSAEELVALFKTLKCPDMAEMHGDYQGDLLAQVNGFARLSNTLLLKNPLAHGIWRSKAFRPIDANRGRGYNTMRHFGRINQKGPMATLIAPSRFDGRPAYQLVYRAYHSIVGTMRMVDDVRRVKKGVYLGLGTWGFTAQQRLTPLPFLLTGPIGAYADDIGEERAGFRVESEIPALTSARS